MSDAQESKPQPHLYLVDGSSYIFRAYHRLPPLTNRHGQPAGAVYGYTTMLWKLAGDLSRADGPTHMAVILDASESTHRNEMYDQYKAHRPPPPEDLVPQFPLIRVATRAFSIPCIEQNGLEADDIIACYVTAAKKAGWKVTIVSSDNVPGVPGIGPKTATQLIQDYGSVEGVLAAVDEIKKPKLKQNLIDFAGDARLSRELVRLVCDAPLPEPLEDLVLKGIPPEPLKEFLEDQGFKSLLNRMIGGSPNTGATVR